MRFCEDQIKAWWTALFTTVQLLSVLLQLPINLHKSPEIAQTLRLLTPHSDGPMEIKFTKCFTLVSNRLIENFAQVMVKIRAKSHS